MDKKKGLDDLATRLSDMVNEMPNDGLERAMTVTIGGDNHGNITFGNHITINAAPEAKGDNYLSDDELREIVEQGRREARQSWLRNRLNTPTAIMFFLIGLAATGLFNGYLLSVPMSTFNMLVMGGGAIFLGAGVWANRIGEVERGIFQQAREQSIQAKQELQRRRFS